MTGVLTGEYALHDQDTYIFIKIFFSVPVWVIIIENISFPSALGMR